MKRMALHWMHLLPIDRYVVRTSSFINGVDRKIITLLYQPLIGAIAHSLYFALESELEKDQYLSNETTHKTLMTMMGLPLDKIYEERKKLEGIGLLNVYKQKQNDEITYLYELQKPFSPQDFFKDDVLSVYLYNRVGKYRYLQLRDRFTINKVNKEEYQDVTMSFSDVFTSLHHSEISSQQGEISTSLTIDHQQDIVNNDTSNSSYKILEEAFDFSLLIAHLSNMINPKTLLTEKVKETIVRLAFVYRIDPYEMSKVIQDSLLHDDTVDIDVLREKVKNWYKFTYESEPPALGLRTHPEKYRTMSGKKPTTEEEEMIVLYETESPLTLFESLSNGAKVSMSDMKIVESLILDYKLLPGVANVLIYYVLKIDDNKFSKAYVEKIAGQWARQDIKTVTEAMALAKGEYKKRLEREQGFAQIAATKETPVKQRQNNANRFVRKDRLPKWLTEEKKQTKPKQDDDITKVKEELEEKIKRLKSQRKQEG